MDPKEYSNLERVELDHWYYAGKRELVRGWIARFSKTAGRGKHLDCGAGTGLFAKEMSGDWDVSVLDNHEESLQILRSRFPAERVFNLEGGRLPFGDGSFDLVTALDVLEHIERDDLAVEEFQRILKPGGLAVVTVPASPALWSDWDVALHHYRRYERAKLEAVFPGKDWELLHSNYVNVFAFPVVWLVRTWRKLFSSKIHGASLRMEDRVPPRFVNWLLRLLFVAPGLSRLPFPFGVGLILVARRR